MELNSVKATTTYDQKTARLHDEHQGEDARARCHGAGDSASRSSGNSSPELAVRTQGIEWRTAPGSQATVNYARRRASSSRACGWSARDQSLDVTGTLALGTAASAEAIDVHARNVDLQQLQTLALQDRGLSGRLNADAKISGSTAAPVVDGTVSDRQRRLPDLSLRFADARTSTTTARASASMRRCSSRRPSRSPRRAACRRASSRRAANGAHVEADARATRSISRSSRPPISLAIVQGFTNQLTNVTGTLEADVHVAGPGEDPHAAGLRRHQERRRSAFRRRAARSPA